ncbi:GntR family transcriptional regulator [Thalassobaculum sp.]|uniref:GntR family transcriptional regulator n=1 Tax=Thalassobaculum sp. TaxID=2022740 RepID=UPI0032EB7987
MDTAIPTASPRRSIPEDIAAVLREEILDGVQAAGEPLRQGHLAGRFGTSQAPIREALRLLEAQRLVVSAPNRGARVAPLDAAEAAELGELRRSLEPELAARAARNAGAVDAAAARAAVAAMLVARDPAALMMANSRFHDAIYRAAGRPITLELVHGLRARFERHLRLMWRRTGHAALSNDEHAEILRLVLAGADEAVRSTMQLHVERSTAAILSALGASGAS